MSVIGYTRPPRPVAATPTISEADLLATMRAIVASAHQAG